MAGPSILADASVVCPDAVSEPFNGKTSASSGFAHRWLSAFGDHPPVMREIGLTCAEGGGALQGGEAEARVAWG